MFERIYEDNISGKLPDERFAKMSQRYEEEQAALSEKIKALRKELDKLNGDAVSTDMFLATVRKYTRAKKLTPRMLNELVNHIEVHQAEKINGEWVQKLTIYYNCVGALFIPDTPSMPVPDVTVTPAEVSTSATNQLKMSNKMASVLKGSDPIRTPAMVRQKGLDYVKEQTPSSRRLAMVH